MVGETLPFISSYLSCKGRVSARNFIFLNRNNGNYEKLFLSACVFEAVHADTVKQIYLLNEARDIP